MKAQLQRQQLVDLCLDLSRRGFFSGTGGNVAVRIDAENIVVTPSALDYHVMTAADVCVLRLSDLSIVDGERQPSVETSLHAKVLRARADVNCSIHTHQPVASACALIGETLQIINPELWDTLGHCIPVVGYAPSGTSWLAKKLAMSLRRDVNAYLMRNHGVLCCGATVDAAVETVEVLEQLTRQHLHRQINARAGKKSALQPALQRVLNALEHA